jgi:hypothetical protein
MLIAANLFTVFFAVKERWDLGEVMQVYWWQNVIIGLFTVVRLLTADRMPCYAGKGPGGSGLSMPASVSWPLAIKMALAGFFVLHYGFFHFGYWEFLHFGGERTNSGFMVIATGIFFVNHLFSFFYHHRRQDGPQDLPAIMMGPYPRIIPMHLTIILGMFIMAMTGVAGASESLAEVIVLILFLGLKTAIDVQMHLAEHGAIEVSWLKKKRPTDRFEAKG